MSWSSGISLYESISNILKKHVSDAAVRTRLHMELIELFEAEDCDGLFELLEEDSWGYDEAFVAAWKQLKGDEED